MNKHVKPNFNQFFFENCRMFVEYYSWDRVAIMTTPENVWQLTANAIKVNPIVRDLALPGGQVVGSFEVDDVSMFSCPMCSSYSGRH